MKLENKLNEKKAQKRLEEDCKIRNAQKKSEFYLGIIPLGISAGLGAYVGYESTETLPVAYGLISAGFSWLVTAPIANYFAKKESVYGFFKDKDL